MPPEPLHANLELVPVSPIYHYIWQNVCHEIYKIGVVSILGNDDCGKSDAYVARGMEFFKIF